MKFERQVPGGLLWHYTNAQGFYGITTQKELWATHVEYLNDRTEGVHAAVLLEALLKRVFPTQAAARAALTGRRADAFVFAMSERGDRLDNWRVYANGGRGYALGFGRKSVAKVPNAILQQCEYIDPALPLESQDFAIRAAIDARADVWALISESGDKADPRRVERQVRSWVDAAVSKLGPALKHIAFAEEREHRLVYSGSHVGLRLRVSPTDRLVPYVPLQFESEMLLTVCLGPGMTVADERATRLHLEANGYSDVEVIASNVPLQAI